MFFVLTIHLNIQILLITPYHECLSLSLGAPDGGGCGMGGDGAIGGTLFLLICWSVFAAVMPISAAYWTVLNLDKSCELARLKWSLRARIPSSFTLPAAAVPLRGGEGDSVVSEDRDSWAISGERFFLGSRSIKKKNWNNSMIFQTFLLLLA